ncbi:hypothetical protein CK228_32475 [Mesorhizobium sp. WSM4312]|nr:hypothetical protein CK228_32475 [Mesorhizobium sp. WSM4312]
MVRAIAKDELSNFVLDTAQIKSLANHDSDTMFPQFAIDHLVRLASIQAGAKVLQSLQMLVLLTGDKNVSATAGEVLRPDIVCINPERQSVVLFELKKTAQTGRQALTELLAYEQEIKNLLPLVCDYDFSFVLVSPEWSPLIDHAVSGAIAWSGRNILCLTPSIVKKKLCLETRIPSAWKITGSVYFPEDAIPSVTVCLYRKDAYSAERRAADTSVENETDELDLRIWTALEVIAREGDRSGGHGFALLWKDGGGFGLTDYNITVCGLAPFAFYDASRKSGVIGEKDGWLVEKLDEYGRDYDPAGHSDALITTATAAYPLLKEVSDPKVEGFSTWEADRHVLRRRSEPLLCEFWGVLGDYARSYVMNPAVRKHRRNTLRNGLGDWRDPSVGLPLIQSFTRPEIFFEGEVRCSDAFRLGLLIGFDRMLRLNIRDHDHPGLRIRFKWNRIELMTAIDEMRLLADAAENVSPPDEPFRFYDDPLHDDDDDNERLLRWLVKEFFGGSSNHHLFFDIGLNGCLVFDERKQGLSGEPIPPDWVEKIADHLREATARVLYVYRQIEREGGLWGALPGRYDLLRRMLGLRKNYAMNKVADISAPTLLSAWDVCLEASDLVLDTAYHRHADIALTAVDWVWLQQGIAEMRERGEADAGVILLPNGQLVTGRVLPIGVNLNLKIDSPEEQVPFLDRSHGFGLMRIVTWADLKSGEAFKPSSKPDAK